MLNNILGKVTKPQHASVHNYVSRAKNLEGGQICPPPPDQIGLRKMSSICEQYASEYGILFNGSKSKLLFFKGRCCNVSTLGIFVCSQLVEMLDTAVHLSHTITSNDRDNITKSAKSSF